MSYKITKDALKEALEEKLSETWQSGGAGRDALREELVTYPYGGSGLEYNILFEKQGYTPHGVEHVIDPVDGREKLVLFDPHTRRSVIIYDVKKREIEWEVSIPGTERPNPHEGGMLLEDISGFGEAGDIYCLDRDQNVIVIDRETRTVKFQQRPPNYDPSGWFLGIKKGIDDSLILSDYFRVRVEKVSIPDLTLVWDNAGVIQNPLHISIIEGAGLEMHNPSFGGEYLVVANHGYVSADDAWIHGAVFELKDSDGTIAWQRPTSGPTGNPDYRGEGMWIPSPSAAFRLGRVENYGNVTVVADEGGGGIIGIGYTGEPMFGVLGITHEIVHLAYRYSFNPYGLAEVTHIFPTLNGRIGFVAWCGFNLSIVGEIVRLPTKQVLPYCLAYNYTTGDDWAFLSPIHAAGSEHVQIGVKNTGANSMDLIIYGYMPSFIDEYHYPTVGRFTVQSSVTIATGDEYEADFIHPFSFYRVAVKSTTPGSSTTCNVYVTKARGQ